MFSKILNKEQIKSPYYTPLNRSARFVFLSILIIFIGIPSQPAASQNKIDSEQNQEVHNSEGIDEEATKKLIELEREKLELERKRLAIEEQRFELEKNQDDHRKEQDDHKNFWGISGVLGTSGALLGTFATLLGTAATTAAGIFIYLNWRTAQKKLLTERFSSAVELLGKAGEKNIQVRVGASDALEQLAKDAPEQYQVVVKNVLLGFIRENSWLGEGHPRGQNISGQKNPGVRKKSYGQEIPSDQENEDQDDKFLRQTALEKLEKKTSETAPADIQDGLRIINALSKKINALSKDFKSDKADNLYKIIKKSNLILWKATVIGELTVEIIEAERKKEEVEREKEIQELIEKVDELETKIQKIKPEIKNKKVAIKDLAIGTKDIKGIKDLAIGIKDIKGIKDHVKLIEESKVKKLKQRILEILAIIGLAQRTEKVSDSTNKILHLIIKICHSTKVIEEVLDSGSEIEKITQQSKELKSNAREIHRLAKYLQRDHEADLSHSNLKYAWFNRFRLTDVRFYYSNLQKGFFERAELKRANFWGANLTEADFKNADLVDAKLGKTTFLKTKLQGANLTGANLEKSRFKGTSLKEVNLTDTIFLKADLSRCTEDELNKDVLEHSFLCSTILPKYLQGEHLADRDCANPKFHKVLADKRSSLENSVEKAKRYIEEEIIGSERYKDLESDWKNWQRNSS